MNGILLDDMYLPMLMLTSMPHPEVGVLEGNTVKCHAVGGLLNASKFQEGVGLVGVDLAGGDGVAAGGAAACADHQLIDVLPQVHLHTSNGTASQQPA